MKFYTFYGIPALTCTYTVILTYWVYPNLVFIPCMYVDDEDTAINVHSEKASTVNSYLFTGLCDVCPRCEWILSCIYFLVYNIHRLKQQPLKCILSHLVVQAGPWTVYIPEGELGELS